MLPIQSEKVACTKVDNEEVEESSDEDSENNCMAFTRRGFKKEAEWEHMHSSLEEFKKNWAKRKQLQKMECEKKLNYGWTEESYLKWMKIEKG